MKKYFVFSDVHGDFSILKEALSEAGFDPKNKNHILLSLGDNFDRGNENAKVLKFLLKYRKQKRLLAILGNHDKFLLNLLEKKGDSIFNCMYNGFSETVAELAESQETTIMGEIFDDQEIVISKIKEKYPELMNFLHEMKDIYTFGDYIFTHGGLYEELEEDGEISKWYPINHPNTEYFIKYFPEQMAKKYIFGHWYVQKLSKRFLNASGSSSEPFIYKSFIGIDACTIISRKINILVLEEQEGQYILRYKDQIL